jgi:hypothetical protein
MFLQTLFALYSLAPAITASTPRSPFNHAALDHHTVVVQGSRRFTADLFSPRALSADSRYPGTIIIATDETRDRAFLVASRMAEIGITAMMYVQDDSLPIEYLMQDARAAVDSMRRRYDVRAEEIGVIAFEQATTVVPNLVHDTTLDFAIAASSAEPTRSVISRYANAHTATLLVRGVKNLKDSAAIMRALGLDGPRSPEPADSARIAPPPTSPVAPNVTVWPVPRDQLKGIGETDSPLSMRMMGWVRDQVHTDVMVPNGSGVSVH